MSISPPRNSFNRLFCSRIIMSSKHLLKPTPITFPLTPSSRAQQHSLFHNPNKKLLFFSSFPPKLSSNLRCFSVRTSSGFSNVSHASVSRPIPEVYLENPEVNRADLARLEVLARKMEELDIDIGGCTPGQYNHLLCPMCKGGTSMEKSLSLFITQDGDSALWMCFRGKCGWKGRLENAQADVKSSYGRLNPVSKASAIRQITEEDLELEPLCDESE